MGLVPFRLKPYFSSRILVIPAGSFTSHNHQVVNIYCNVLVHVVAPSHPDAVRLDLGGKKTHRPEAVSKCLVPAKS